MSGQKCVCKSKLRQFSDSKQCSIVQNQESSGCVLSCCQSCSFCSFTRASAKERSKPRQLSEQNKVCQKCILCRSLCFCPCCSQCPQCCLRTECRGQTSGILASLASHGFKSPGSLYPKTGLHLALQTKTGSNQVPSGSKWLCKPIQKHASQRGSCKSHAKVGSRKGSGQVVPGLLQPPVPGSQTERQMETNLRLKSFESLSQYRHIQDGNSGNNPLILEDGGVGHFAGLQRRLLPHPHSPKIKKVSQVLPVPANFPVHSPTLRFGHGSTGVYQNSQGGEADGSGKGYQDPPVPRRLVAESPFPGNLPTAYPDPLGPMSRIRLGSEYDQVRVGSHTGLQFRRLPVRPDLWSGITHSGPLASPSREVEVHKEPSQVYRPSVHVSNRSLDSHGEAGLLRSPSHETFAMAPQEELACPRSFGKGDPSPSISLPSLGLVVGRKQCSERATSAPSSARRSTIYRRLKRRLGRTLRRLHCKRRLVPSRRSPSYKFSRDESSPSGLTTVRASVQGSDCSCGNGQYQSGLLHKQTGGYEVRLSLCPPLETPVLVPSQGHNAKGKTHSGSLKCDSRQALSAQSSDSDRMVSLPSGFQSVVFQVAPTASGLVCDQVQSQTAPVCVTSPGSGSLGSRCPELVLGASERLCIPSSLPAPSGSFEDKGSGLSQDDSDCPRLAKHALVLGPGGPIRSDPLHPSSNKGPSDSAFQRASSPEPSESQSSCLAPRSSTIRKHGFSEEVAARIEAPQRGSTRAVYKSKWTIFVKWCKSNKVDFRSPSVNHIADFLLYLFKERNLQPSTIDGYRTAIADMVGNDKLNISSDENLTRLLDSFHRDKPKGRRGVPSWNLSLVLHQLTKAPFKPLRKASLKHLTFKTVFLLALGSGKRRSEIHAWLAKNIRHQEDWSKVSLYPSPSFLSKNQLARDGPASVAPVVIPALAPTLDKSLSGDRSLCPVRALRYYLDRTKDSRQGKELVFVSFKTGFQKDIVPATISSWVKQTVLLCYQLSDQKAQDLHQVRAHNVRAFAASRAFQGGISLDQILSACHWKAHNTFTQFYLKDLAWADSELYHLGPVVAAQQIQDTQ